MKTVLINGVVHAVPFADLFDPLTHDELTALTESGKQLGFFHPVLTFDSPTHGRSVLDGLNRAELALAHNITLPVQHLDTIPDESAEFIARRVNADRRHLTPEAQQRARQGRVGRVAKKRANGKSIRQIADEEGVSKSQVERDLSTVPGGTVELEKVIGKDGKSRPAKKPTAYPSAVESPPPPDEPDAYFRPRESFADEVRSAVRKLKDVKSLVSCVFESPHAELARQRAKVHGLRWSWDGEEPVSERLGVTVMQRTWTCDEWVNLFEFCCELEAFLRRDVPTPTEEQPWE